MAGTDPRFNAAAVRDALRFAMTMGLPDTTEHQATFIWTTDKEFAQADSGNTPFNLGAVPTTTTEFEDVQVPVAVEFFSKGGDSQKTRVGEFDTARCTITVLDEDYESLFQGGRRPDRVRLKDSLYRIEFEAPPVGLFDLTVYQFFCISEDEV